VEGTATAGSAFVDARPSPLTRFLRLFGDVKDGEGVIVLLLLSNIFVILAGYYVCKTVREPLILTGGGAEMKSYASAGQAVVLMGFVPLYGWFASRVDRIRLLLGITAFFIVNLELFRLGIWANVPYIGLAFFVWVGIFSNAVVAQFWSYGNDLFDKPTGERLFPIIGIGATLGSPLGAAFAENLFGSGTHPYTLLHIAAGCLLASMALYWLVERRVERRHAAVDAPLKDGRNGFALIFSLCSIWSTRRASTSCRARCWGEPTTTRPQIPRSTRAPTSVPFMATISSGSMSWRPYFRPSSPRAW
jgi:AAA family ATP:ADP antiporter